MSLSAHHDLQQVLIHIHNRVGYLLVSVEEDDGVECHLKLRANANEGAAQWLQQAFPAELQTNDTVVHIQL